MVLIHSIHCSQNQIFLQVYLSPEGTHNVKLFGAKVIKLWCTYLVSVVSLQLAG